MSNETKQTAVDQIVNLLNKEGFAPVLTEEEIKFFKEMEKEQIINAVDEGISQGYGKYIDTEWGRENDWKAEQYYNETYGGNK